MAMVLLVNLSYFAGLQVTPYELLFHPEYGFIRRALIRLFLHTAALALIFTFEMFTFPKISKENTLETT